MQLGRLILCIRLFADGRISAVEFEVLYLELFKNSSLAGGSKAAFPALERLFFAPSTTIVLKSA